MKRTVFLLIIFSCFLALSCVTTHVNDKKIDLDEAKYTLHYNLGTSHMNNKRFTYAMEEFLEAEKYKGTPELYYSMGQSCYLLERYDVSKVYFDKALFLDKDFSMAYVGRGNLYMALNRYEDAIDEFEKALENIIFHEPEAAYFGMALAYIGLNEIENAIKNLKRSIQLNPQFFPSYYQLGNIYMDLGDYDSAADSFQELLKYYPDSPEGHLMLGKTYLKLNNKLMAEMEFKEVIKLAPNTELSKEAMKHLTGENH